MRPLKVLILLIFVASLINTNICHTAGVPNKNNDSGASQLLISGFENIVSPAFINRGSQAGKITTIITTGLPKLILASSSKTKLLHNCNFIPFNSFSETNDFSLASLHCLLII